MKKQLLTYVLIALDQLLVTGMVRYYPQLVNHGSVRWFHFLPGIWSFLLALVLLFLLVRFTKLASRSWVAVALLLAGVMSNLITSIRFKEVVDYIPLPTTYANAADLMIVIGCGVAVVTYLRKRA